MELKELQELDDLSNIYLVSSGTPPEKPKAVPVLDFTDLYEVNTEENTKQETLQKQTIKAKDKAPRMGHFPSEEIFNTRKLTHLKFLRVEKLKSKVQERIENQKKIKIQKIPFESTLDSFEFKDISIENIIGKVKNEIKLKSTVNVYDLHEVKIKNRLRQSIYFIKKAKEQGNYLGHSLIQATLSENLRFIEGHIDSCVNDRERMSFVNTTDQYQRTALHYAAGLGLESAVSMMLLVGSNPFLKDFKLRTALHYAGFSNNPKIVSSILRSSANYSKLQKNMLTYNNHYTIARLLKCKKLEKTLVFSENQSAEPLKSFTIFIDFTSFHDGTQLLVENMNKNCGKSRLYDDKHARFIDFQDDEGRTPLHLAVINEKPSTVQALLDYGAKISLEDINGKRPLELSKSKLVTSLLLSKLKQSLASKKNPAMKNIIDNRDLKALSEEDITKFKKKDFSEGLLM